MELTKELYGYRQRELLRLSRIKYHGYTDTLREIGISYLGAVNHSAKLMHNKVVGVDCYGVYLSAADNAYGLEVCNKQTSRFCRKLCLVGSGRGKISYLSGKHDIQDARNRKTMLYFANRDLFCKLLSVEIDRAKKRAEMMGHLFAVRFNCTSDIPLTSLNRFEGGKNILEAYPDVVFYDYTKRPMNLKISRDYKNYHVVLSYYKGNDDLCKEWLRKGGSIAVVFGVTKAEQMPKTFMGHNVINGDLYDARFLDPANCVVGLKYKIGGNDFKIVNGKHVFKGIPDSELIVKC